MATAALVLKLNANYSNDPNGSMSALICRPPNGAARRARNTRDRFNPLLRSWWAMCGAFQEYPVKAAEPGFAAAALSLAPLLRRTLIGMANAFEE
jgi:hypothetical protein